MKSPKMAEDMISPNVGNGQKSTSKPVPISRKTTAFLRPKMATTMKAPRTISKGANQNKFCRNLESLVTLKQTPTPPKKKTTSLWKYDEEKRYQKLLDKYVFCGRNRVNKSKKNKPEPGKMFRSQTETSSSGNVETKSSANSTSVPSSPISCFEFPILQNYKNLQDACKEPAPAVPKLYSVVHNQGNDYEKISALGRIKISNPNDELIIISQGLINKARNVAINTLALEQTGCHYVEKRWFNEFKSSWRENEMRRQNRIYEEQMLINILRQKSSLTRELEERYKTKLSLPQVHIIKEETAPRFSLPEITEGMRTVIDNGKRQGNIGEVLVQVRLPKDTINLTRRDIQTLAPNQWLNDNVINTYLGLLTLRSKLENNFPTVYAFQTFFYPKLLNEGYSNSLKRWTRKDDIFAHDLIIVPIHLGVHWCLACVDLRSKSIRYFDSLGVANPRCLGSILDYITKEMKERKKVNLDTSEWSLENVKNIPMQKNGFDCGMFACKFAEYLSRDSDFTFTQENMSYYRDRMVYEFLTQELLFP